MGYRSMMGWVQLVRSTDNASGGTEFESDPFALFGDAPSPYCWYGLNPTLFDGPSRSVRDDLEWEAHSFLATTSPRGSNGSSAATRRPVGRVLWGFRIADGVVHVSPATELSIERWNDHTDGLRAQYQFWNFTNV